MTVILFLLANLFAPSAALNALPQTEGSYFVFSFHPFSRAILSISSKHGGGAEYVVTCVRNCQNKYTALFGNVSFPSAKIECLPRSNQLSSGKNLPVFMLTSNVNLYVIMAVWMNEQIMDATLLFPSQVSGKDYYFITHHSNGILILTSYNHSETTVCITLKNNIYYLANEAPRNIPNGTPLRVSDALQIEYDLDTADTDKLNISGDTTITLEPLESYYIRASSSSDITGMYITSDRPIAAIQGADVSMVRGARKVNLLLDSIAPVESLGRLFVVPYFTVNPDRSDVKVVTAVDGNVVHIQADTDIYALVLAHASDWFDFMMDSHQTVFVFADQAIMVERTIVNLRNDDTAGSCMTSVIPVEQWSNSYTWSDLSSFQEALYGTGSTLQRLLVIAIASNFTSNVRLDDKAIPDNEWHTATPWIGCRDEKVTYRFTSRQMVRTSKRNHVLYVRDLPYVALFALVYSYDEFVGYCLTPSRVFKKINVPSENCSRTFVSPGDLLDNDCDGKFDEEPKDDLDNDGDGLIDEDLQPDKRVDGGWGEWNPHICLTPCGTTQGMLYRARRCNNPPVSGSGLPCIGAGHQNNNTVCTSAYIKCASECEAKEWGFNCSERCENCDPDCHTENGTCEQCVAGFIGEFCNETCRQECKGCDEIGNCLDCKPGFFGPPICEEKCPPMHHGPNCTLVCSDMCKDRCDPVTGDCVTGMPTPQTDAVITGDENEERDQSEDILAHFRFFWYMSATMPVLWVGTCAVWFHVKRQRQLMSKDEESEDTTSVETGDIWDESTEDTKEDEDEDKD